MNFDDDVTAKNLKSFMFKSFKILERKNTSDSQTFSNEDVFVVNEAFTS